MGVAQGMCGGDGSVAVTFNAWRSRRDGWGDARRHTAALMVVVASSAGRMQPGLPAAERG
jgi:hypothetical protein